MAEGWRETSRSQPIWPASSSSLVECEQQPKLSLPHAILRPALQAAYYTRSEFPLSKLGAATMQAYFTGARSSWSKATRSSGKTWCSDAIRRGKWISLEQEALQGIRGPEEIDSPRETMTSKQRLKRRLQEFRYERDLITAQEMEDWLAIREVSLRDWMDHVRRRTAGARVSSGMSRSRCAPPDGSGSARQRLAGGPGSAREWEESCGRAGWARGGRSREPGILRLDQYMRRCRLGCLPGSPRSTPRERVNLLARIDQGAEAFRRERGDGGGDPSGDRASPYRMDPDRFPRHRIRGRSRRARGGHVHARGRPARWTEVAAAAHATVAESRFYLDDLDLEFRNLFLGARPIDVLGPIFFEGAHTLFRVVDKVMPSEQDPEILQRAEAGVAGRLVAAQAQQRVQWQLPW